MSKSRPRLKSSPQLGVKLSASSAEAEFKVFFIASEQLEKKANNANALHLERFYHPGKGRATLFLTNDDKELLEILEYAEPRRSWLIGNRVCSNGRLYMTAPIDATFLALHHIRRHCAERALALDNICVDEVDEADEEIEPNKNATAASTRRLLSTFVAPASLRCIADVKSAAGMTFYKYNAEKALAWLALKTRHIAASLRAAGVHCGHSALSQNYARSERAPSEEMTTAVDYLRMACDIVGGYLDLELHEQLNSYLEITSELKAKAEEAAKAASGVKKRKSLETLSAVGNKKLKLNGSLLDDSLDENIAASSPASAGNGTPRSLSAKEKALAKGAKGTKSIASFFKK